MTTDHTHMTTKADVRPGSRRFLVDEEIRLWDLQSAEHFTSMLLSYIAVYRLAGWLAKVVNAIVIGAILAECVYDDVCIHFRRAAVRVLYILRCVERPVHAIK